MPPPSPQGDPRAALRPSWGGVRRSARRSRSPRQRGRSGGQAARVEPFTEQTPPGPTGSASSARLFAKVKRTKASIDVPSSRFATSQPHPGARSPDVPVACVAVFLHAQEGKEGS